MSTLVEAILLLVALLHCLLGCSLLALSHARNWRKVLEDRSATPPKFAWLGWTLVLSALVPCVGRDGASFAALLWPLVFAAGAVATALTLTYRPGWYRAAIRVLTISR